MTGPVDPTAALTPEVPGPSTPPPGRSRRLVVGIVIATLVLGGLIGAGVVLLLSGGDDDSQVGVATSTSVASTTSTIPATTAPTTTAAPTTSPVTAVPPEAAVPPETAAPTTATTLPLAVVVAPVITQLEVTPTDVTCLPGETFHLTIVWATEHATEVGLNSEGGWGVGVPSSGTRTANIQCLPGETPQNIVYVLTATGPGGTTSRTATVHVTIT